MFSERRRSIAVEESSAPGTTATSGCFARLVSRRRKTWGSSSTQRTRIIEQLPLAWRPRLVWTRSATAHSRVADHHPRRSDIGRRITIPYRSISGNPPTQVGNAGRKRAATGLITVKPKLQIGDLFRQQIPESPVWSPDGSRVVYVVAYQDRQANARG